MDTLVAEVPREAHSMPILSTLAALSPASVPLVFGVGLSVLAGAVQGGSTISETIPNTIVGVALVTVVVLFLKAFRESEAARLADAAANRQDHAGQLKALQETFTRALETHTSNFATVLRDQIATTAQIGGSLRELATATAALVQASQSNRQGKAE